MPARVKQESVDVDGNQYVVSATDVNRHDEEIRAIEKVIGVPKLPVPGGPTPTDECSILSTLVQIAEQLKKIRDDFVLTTSGVVAVRDSNVVGVDGLIPFPTAWSTTTLAVGFSGLTDTVVNDEDLLEKLDYVELTDVTGLPDEGYVTVPNDISIAPAPVSHTTSLIFYSPTTANGKVNREFIYDILVSLTGATVTLDATTALPLGLSLSNNTITGVPSAVGTTVVRINATTGSQTTSMSLTITVVEESTPALTGNPLSASGTMGTVFSYTLPFTGALDTVTAAGLPGGLTMLGNTITGTPREPLTSVITLTATDEFGDTATGTLTLTVGL